MADAGDDVVGTALCYARSADMGSVRGLGVRRGWRGSGIGVALLQHTFGAFYAHGRSTMGLGVDAQSPTGATRLYRRAGMRVAEEYETYEKVASRIRAIHWLIKSNDATLTAINIDGEVAASHR